MSFSFILPWSFSSIILDSRIFCLSWCVAGTAFINSNYFSLFILLRTVSFFTLCPRYFKYSSKWIHFECFGTLLCIWIECLRFIYRYRCSCSDIFARTFKNCHLRYTFHQNQTFPSISPSTLTLFSPMDIVTFLFLCYLSLVIYLNNFFRFLEKLYCERSNIGLTLHLPSIPAEY